MKKWLVVVSILLGCEIVKEGDIKESKLEITINDIKYKLYTVFDGKDYIKIMVPVNTNDPIPYSSKVVSSEEKSSTTIYLPTAK